MRKKILNKAAACLLSSFMVLTGSAAVITGIPSVSSLAVTQTVYAADNGNNEEAGSLDEGPLSEGPLAEDPLAEEAEGSSESPSVDSSSAAEKPSGSSSDSDKPSESSSASGGGLSESPSAGDGGLSESPSAGDGGLYESPSAGDGGLSENSSAGDGGLSESSSAAERTSDGETHEEADAAEASVTSGSESLVETIDGQEAEMVQSQALAADNSVEILAERVDGADILEGDKIIIVCDALGTALSLNPSGSSRIAPVSVTVNETEDRQVLTQIPEGTAVLEVESAGERGILLKSPQGYLTSSSTGNRLYYAESPEDCSIWEIRDGEFLYNINAVSTSGTNTYRNYYLEYYGTGRYFTVYGKSSKASPAPFQMAFYRLGNSDLGAVIKDDSVYLLPVFQTSDIHGYLANTDGGDPLYLLAYISDKVKDVRGYGADARMDRALLLDGGDIYQGNTMSNLLEGESLSAAFQIMGYDAVTIGNHDFDWGIENTVDSDGTMMDHSLGEGSGYNLTPVIASNIYHDGEKISFADDYIILEKTAVSSDGSEIPVRIGVIGFAENYAASIMYSNFTGAGYSIDPDPGIANRLAASLEASGACDATILLTHQEAGDAAKSLGQDTVFDLVLGGHTHYNVNGVTNWNLPYLQPAGKGAAYTYSELSFRVEDGSPVFDKVVNARNVQVTSDPSKLTGDPDNADDLDPALVDLTDEVLDTLREIFDEEIGYITESAYRYVYLPESGKRSTTYGNWVADIYRRIAGADIAFVNSGGLRIDMPVEEGEISRSIKRSDLYTMFPFSNEVYCFEISGEELLQAFEYALSRYGGIILSQMVGIDCYYTDNTVNALVTQDGKAIYVNGEQEDGTQGSAQDGAQGGSQGGTQDGTALSGNGQWADVAQDGAQDGAPGGSQGGTQDGTALTGNGQWADGWKDKTFTVAMTDYMATTDRDYDGLHNPFVAWKDTSRLILSGRIDNEWAYKVLTEEASQNGGLLSFDTHPHFINQEYTGELYTEESEDPGEGENPGGSDNPGESDNQGDSGNPGGSGEPGGADNPGGSGEPGKPADPSIGPGGQGDPSIGPKDQNESTGEPVDGSRGDHGASGTSGSGSGSSGGSSGSGSGGTSGSGSSSGSGNSGNQTAEGPHTGDTNEALMWEALLALSALGLCSLILLRYRQRRNTRIE